MVKVTFHLRKRPVINRLSTRFSDPFPPPLTWGESSLLRPPTFRATFIRVHLFCFPGTGSSRATMFCWTGLAGSILSNISFFVRRVFRVKHCDFFHGFLSQLRQCKRHCSALESQDVTENERMGCPTVSMLEQAPSRSGGFLSLHYVSLRIILRK